MSLRVVFDTRIVVSALVFANGRLTWLRQHWRRGGCVPLVSAPTLTELTRVLCRVMQLTEYFFERAPA